MQNRISFFGLCLMRWCLAHDYLVLGLVQRCSVNRCLWGADPQRNPVFMRPPLDRGDRNYRSCSSLAPKLAYSRFHVILLHKIVIKPFLTPVIKVYFILISSLGTYRWGKLIRLISASINIVPWYGDWNLYDSWFYRHRNLSLAYWLVSPKPPAGDPRPCRDFRHCVLYLFLSFLLHILDDINFCIICLLYLWLPSSNFSSNSGLGINKGNPELLVKLDLRL